MGLKFSYALPLPWARRDTHTKKFPSCNRFQTALPARGVSRALPGVSPRVASLLASYRMGFGSPARNRKKLEKYRKRPPPENRKKKKPKNRKKGSKIGFRGQFPSFRLFLPIFWRRPFSIFFSCFGPEARNPFCSWPTGAQCRERPRQRGVSEIECSSGCLQGPSTARTLRFQGARGRANREVQTVNLYAGKKGAVETGVKSSLKKAHTPSIRGKKGAQTVN